MDEIHPECVLYEPTKDVSFGHLARAKSARAAWDLLQRFLEGRTRSSLDPVIRLQCVWPFDGPVGAFNEFRQYANAVLGTVDRGEWFVDPSRFAQVLNLALDEDRWPRQKEGPAFLSFSYSFEWLAATELPELPWSRSSTLRINITGQRMFLAPKFIFPWAWNSEAVRQFLHDLESDLPLQLRPQYFKRMVTTKKGDYRLLKLPRDWLGSRSTHGGRTGKGAPLN